ncbi:hypothetical protein Q5P01_012824 [Channa striata]|uniref:Uncharacterized protein n=1 Tax=Channa striata TaxID=64152 RepID=A0AA88MT13_CHASR|nr:hypothetical protein Q5P01_012824 [Channa striata]
MSGIGSEEALGGQLLISLQSTMFGLLRPLLAACLYLLLPGAQSRIPRYSNGFHYQDISNGNGNGEIYFNGVRLLVESPNLQCRPPGGAASRFPVTTTTSLSPSSHAGPGLNGPGYLPTPSVYLLQPKM